MITNITFLIPEKVNSGSVFNQVYKSWIMGFPLYSVGIYNLLKNNNNNKYLIISLLTKCF